MPNQARLVRDRGTPAVFPKAIVPKESRRVVHHLQAGRGTPLELELVDNQAPGRSLSGSRTMLDKSRNEKRRDGPGDN